MRELKWADDDLPNMEEHEFRLPEKSVVDLISSYLDADRRAEGINTWYMTGLGGDNWRPTIYRNRVLRSLINQFLKHRIDAAQILTDALYVPFGLSFRDRDGELVSPSRGLLEGRLDNLETQIQERQRGNNTFRRIGHAWPVDIDIDASESHLEHMWAEAHEIRTKLSALHEQLNRDSGKHFKL